MRDDVPAAIPLFIFLIALTAAPWLSRANATAGALALVAAGLLTLRRGRWAMGALAAAAAIFVSHSAQRRAAAETAAFERLNGGTFAAVEAPIERDWSQRPHVTVLRSPRFVAGGHSFSEPIAFYARFEPPPIGDEMFIRAEGFLRRDERGHYSISIKSPRLLSYTGTASSWSPAAWNRRIARRLRRHAATRPDEIAMIEALVLGRGERLSDSTRDEFKRGGTYHLLVFSGLQISIAAAAIALMLRWAGAPRGSDLSLLAFALIAPAFIGTSASVARASCGIALYAISRFAKRPTSFENLWCVAALARLLSTPSDLTDPAFHLTYAGAASLLFLGKPLARTRLRWVAYLFAAELAIAPLTLFHFHQYALGGSIATIVMTPIVFVMLMLGIGFCATELSLFLDMIGLLNSLCSAINVAASPASGFFAAPPVIALAAGLLGALLAIGLLRGRLRTAAVIIALLIPTAAAIHHSLEARRVEHAEIAFLDVGQGDSILLRSGAASVLIDGGGRSDDPRFGESVLLPLLADRGVSRIDVVVLTHAHPDHCGGLEAVLRRMRVGELWLNPRRLRGECAQRMLEAAASSRTPIRLVEGERTARAGAFELRAFTSERPHRRAPENNASIIVIATAFGRRTLLTGDIEREAERAIAPRLTASDILKVPHHGSRTSTGAELLAIAAPRWAVISCGRNNLFGHPHPSVTDALRHAGARTLRTDRNGTIVISLTPRTLLVSKEIDTDG